jgi:hypothetical protein
LNSQSPSNSITISSKTAEAKEQAEGQTLLSRSEIHLRTEKRTMMGITKRMMMKMKEMTMMREPRQVMNLLKLIPRYPVKKRSLASPICIRALLRIRKR